MKLLLTMNLPYTRVHGGTNKSNRSLAEGLAERGHTLRVVVPALATPSSITHEQFIESLKSEGVKVEANGAAHVFELNDVEVHAVAEPSRLRAYLVEQLREFAPDWALVSAEDPSQNLLDAALRVCPARVVYLAHTPQMFPFGPAALYPGQSRTELVGRAAAIVTISRFVADYIKEWTGFEAFVNHPPHFGRGPFPSLGQFDEGYVLLMNACAVKGISIFLELARTIPSVKFAALAGYGTTDDERAALASLPNVTVLKNRKNLDDIFAQTRVLLMPTLWIEGFGMAVVDAMLRGIPVLASNYGGLTEAKLGTDYLLPVQPVESFEERLDTNMLPIPVVPAQDIAPWGAALRELLHSRALYERQSQSAREAALNFVGSLSVEPFEELLVRLSREKKQMGTRPEPKPAHGRAGTSAVEKSAAIADLTPEQRALLMLRLRRKNEGKAHPEHPLAALKPVPRDGELPLSFAQQRLWFLNQLQPGSPFYNTPAALRLNGILNIPALEQSVCEIVRRHESLRTIFPAVEGRPVQVITAPATLPLSIVDLSQLSEPVREAEAQRLATVEAHKPFELATGPLLRATLLRLAADEHVLLFTMHHIISDGWSTGILIREMSTLYMAFSNSQPSPLAPLPIQYADFAHWQREWLKDSRLEEQLAYWRKQLAGAPALLDLRTDRPRRLAQTHRGRHLPFRLTLELSQQLKRLSQEEGATLFMTLLTAFKVLLMKYSGQTDMVVGTPIAGRNRAEVEGLIGFFINTLVLRTQLSGNPSFRELVQRVREVTLGAYEHQEVPFERLVEEMEPERSLSYAPLFQVMFALQNAPTATLKLPGLTLNQFQDERETTQFDLILNMSDTAPGISGTMQFSTDLFNPATVVCMIENFQELLTRLVARPDIRLSELQEILAEAERQYQIKKEAELKEVRLQKFKSTRRKSISESHGDQQARMPSDAINRNTRLHPEI